MSTPHKNGASTDLVGFVPVAQPQRQHAPVFYFYFFNVWQS
jgi:hypothetical protein